MNLFQDLRRWWDDLRGKPRELSREEQARREAESQLYNAKMDAVSDAKLRGRW